VPASKLGFAAKFRVTGVPDATDFRETAPRHDGRRHQTRAPQWMPVLRQILSAPLVLVPADGPRHGDPAAERVRQFDAILR
jgi:hypothetical protein